MAQTQESGQGRKQVKAKPVHDSSSTRYRKPAWDFLRADIIVPCLFTATIVLALLIVMGETTGPKYTRYTTITGFFLQDDPATDSSIFDYTMSNFGLINRTYNADADSDLGALREVHKKTQWQRFEHQVSIYNRESGGNVQYKLLYMGRHGEGHHNVAENYYGTPAWDCYWSEKDGNGTITWADAHLTPAGIAQTVKANDFWRREISEQKIPTPESYYTSPLSRCLETANITFSGLDLPSSHPFIPKVKELFREAIGVHTCDRRGNKTYIHNAYPTYTFEKGFAENDPLWNAITRETNLAQDARTKTVLDDVFSNDDSTYISITSHSGEIGSILRVLGHRTFSLSTGAVIPVLVKAEAVGGSAPSSTSAFYTTVSTCTAPPETSTA